VLGLLAAEALAERFPQAKEGELAPRLNALVSRETCARVAKRRRAWVAALRLSASSSKIGGRETESILAGGTEALMAALYQRRWPRNVARPRVPRPVEPTSSTAPARGKSARLPRRRLQEWAQGQGKPLPTYARARIAPVPIMRRCSRSQVVVKADIDPACSPRASSRQEAEKAAAKALLEREGAILPLK
jgi:ribonuclease-3